MSSETHESIAIRVRRRLNGPETDTLRFQPLVDVALRRLAYDVGISANVENWLQTDKASTTVTLDGDGVADLTDLIDDPRIILECLHYGEIYPPVASGITQPFRLVNNFGQLQLPSAYDPMFLRACLEGTNLITKSVDGVTPLSGDISLSTTYWPTLAQLPDSLVERLVFHDYWLGVQSDNAE